MPIGKGVFVAVNHRDLAVVIGLTLAASSLAGARLPPEPRDNAPPIAASGRLLGSHPGGAAAVDFSPDGRLLASGGGDRIIRLWDLAAGKELRQLKGHAGFICCVAFAPDGRLLASSGHDKEIHLWDLADGRLLARLDGHPEGVRRVAFAPDGRRLASGGWDRTIRVWDRASGKEVFLITGMPGPVWSVAFAPDGKTLAASSRDGTVSLYDAATGKEVRTFPGLNADVYYLHFAPDGKTLLAGGEEGVMVLWEVATARVIRRFEGHGAQLSSVAFTPDGRAIISAAYDKTARLWEVASGMPIRQLTAHRDWVWGVAVSPDGRSAATASKDGSIRLWELRGPPLPVVKLSPAQLEKLWNDLADIDAAPAYQAVWALADSGAQAVSFLSERLRPTALPPDAALVPRLIAELDDDRFAVRERASAELERLGRLAVPALKRTLEGQPSPEVRRRIEMLLEKLDGAELSPERLRASRALQVLALIGSAEARQVIERVAQGPPADDLTQEAKVALEHLDRQSR